MMDRKRYEFILRADSPIAHHAEVFGNQAVIMRRKTRQADGSFADVPIISADTMRHGLREAAAYAVLDAAGLLDVGGLSEGAIRLLFAGGMVTGKGDASVVKLDAYRQLCELVPPLALLGGCADNRVIPGRVQVDDAVLICDESAHQLPAWVTEYMRDHGGAIDTCRAHVVEEQRVRMDPTLDPGKRKLLTEGDQVGVNARLLASETASASGDAVGKQEAKSTMMPRRYETLAAGSLLYWGISATCYSELDVDTLHVMVASFLSSARVGGKRGTGHGLIAPITARQCAVLRPRETPDTLDFAGLATRMGSTFSRHMADRAAQVREALVGVNA